MNNLIWGIITISVSLIGYVISWRLINRNKTFIAVSLLIICGLILRIFVSTDLFLHQWDERYHALVAKNMIHHPFTPTLYDKTDLPYGKNYWIDCHIWLHKQPLPLWTMAFSLWLFGINEFSVRIPSIILTTLGIFLTFSIGRFLFNQKIGFIASFLYSINGLILEMTGGRYPTDHIDIFFLFFIELAILLSILYAQNKNPIYNIFCGISIGAAILSKWLPALIVLPIYLLVLEGSKKFTKKEILISLSYLILFLLLTSLPWQLYIYKEFPNEARYESSFNFKHITEVLENQGGPFYYHFNKLRINYGELIYLPILWFIWKTLKKLRNYKRTTITIWFLLPFLFFSLASTKMQGYTLFTAPAIFLITAYFWYYLYFYRRKIKYYWISYTVLLLLIILPIRFSIERLKPFNIQERNPQWAKELRNINKIIIEKKAVIFNTEYPIETMFYSDYQAYSYIPDNKLIKELRMKGYTVYFKDNGNLDNKLLLHQGVKIFK